MLVPQSICLKAVSSGDTCGNLLLWSYTSTVQSKSPLRGHLGSVNKDIWGSALGIVCRLSLLNFLFVLHVQEENTVFVMTNVILTLNQRQGRCPEVGTGSALILPCVGGRVWAREFIEFSVIIVPLQLPDDKTECKVKNNCVPGYVSTHSNGKKPAERAPSTLCCDTSVLCLPSCKASSISLQSPHSLTPKRTEREAQIFLLGESRWT